MYCYVNLRLTNPDNFEATFDEYVIGIYEGNDEEVADEIKQALDGDEMHLAARTLS